jgi:hypothetical protein
METTQNNIFQELLEASVNPALTTSQKMDVLFRDSKTTQAGDLQVVACFEDGYLARDMDHTYFFNSEDLEEAESLDLMDQEEEEEFWAMFLDTTDAPLFFHSGYFIDKDLEAAFTQSIPQD